MKRNNYLIAGGMGSGVASLLHFGITIGGPAWYRAFGAGEGLAQLAESGSTYPAFMTATIASILAIWALYAFSGARIIGRLPLLKVALGCIAVVYLVRGVLGIPAVVFLDDPYLKELEQKMTFMIFSSVISLGLGCLYLLGLLKLLRVTERRDKNG